MNVQTTLTYDAYGNHAYTPGRARTRYAGELREADTGWYMLGERPYSPMMRRFLAADRASPTGRGGINRYAYCSGDPINRIDPGGNTWLAWLGATMGLAGGASAGRSMSPKSGGLGAAAATPSTMASSAAGVTDAVSITAAIGPPAMTSSPPGPGDLLGWTAMGTNASAGTQLPPARPVSSRGHLSGLSETETASESAHGGAPRNPKIELVTATSPHRLMMSFGEARVRPQWIYGSHIKNLHSEIMAVDTSLRTSDIEDILPRLVGQGIFRFNLYTGNHGEPYGRNWHVITGRSARPHAQFVRDDENLAAFAADWYGMKIDIVDMGKLTKQEMQDCVLENGLHVIATCHGIADEVIMEALNIKRITVYNRTHGAQL